MSGRSTRLTHNFGAMPDELSSWENARVVLIPVPYDLTSTYRSGSRRGPGAVITASMNMELYDEELGVETGRIGIHTQEELEPVVSSPADMMRAVEHAVGEVIAAGKLPVVIGGDHSLTIGALRAVAKSSGPLTILQLDAHADLRDSYLGSRIGHACVGRRASELGKLVQAGVRSLSAEEEEFRTKSEVTTFPAPDMVAGRIGAGDISGALGETVYVTIDLDVFDPGVMPSVGTPEPGGLGWYDVVAVLREAARGRRIVGFDVVELCPVEGNIAPDFIAAKLIYRFLGYIFAAELKQAPGG